MGVSHFEDLYLSDSPLFNAMHHRNPDPPSIICPANPDKDAISQSAAVPRQHKLTSARCRIGAPQCGVAQLKSLCPEGARTAG